MRKLNSKWSNPQSIIDAYAAYIKTHKRLPHKSEICSGSLPKPASIKYQLGLTVREFYQKYFSEYINRCDLAGYDLNDSEFYINEFAIDYKRVSPKSRIEYDKFRNHKLPCTKSLIKISGMTWTELLEYCKLNEKVQFSYNIVFNETPDTIRRINEILNRI